MRLTTALLPLLLLAPLAAPILAAPDGIPLLPPGLVGADFLGYASAIDGDTLVVGARGDDELGGLAGAAYVYVRSGDAWTLQQKLLADDGASGDTFGSAVAIDGDTIVVGAPEQGIFGPGKAYVFVRSGGTWTQQGKLVPSVPASIGSFGVSVGIDGDTAVAGAPHPQDLVPQIGDAYVYVRSGTTWSQQQRLLATDATAGDYFGNAISVSGDLLLVGASKDDDKGTDSGSAYVFARSGGTWTQQQKLLAPDGFGLDRFGASVSIDGTTAAVGAWGDDDLGGAAGAAWVFVSDAGAWSPQAKLLAADGVAGDIFGGLLSLDGDLLAVGANISDSAVPDGGAAYLFQRRNATWTQASRLLAPAPATGDSFGYSIGLSGETVVVGANLASTAGTQSGGAWVFNDLLTGPWTDLGFALAGVSGPPLLVATGTLEGGAPTTLDLTAAAPGAFCALFLSIGANPVPFKGGSLVTVPPALQVFLFTDGTGAIPIAFPWPSGLPGGAPVDWQYAIQDAAAPFGVALSNAVEGVTP